MTREEVKELMASSKSQKEWNINCDKVKAVFGNDYPKFWFGDIIMSGVFSDVSKSW